MSFRVLSIDGGGIRGIIPSTILLHLEQEIKKQYGTDKDISDYFDLMVGTSTGGILALTLCIADENGKQKYSAQELVDVYVKNGPKIFNKSIWRTLSSVAGLNEAIYDEKALEDVLFHYFEDQRLSHLRKPCLIPAYDIENRQPHFFRQSSALECKHKDFYIKDVARATSAAPTYFEPANIKSAALINFSLIDGGLYANNPSMCAFAEARNRHDVNSVEDISILSLGTGEEKQPYPYHKAKDWGATSWIKPVIDIMAGGVSDTNHFQLQQLFASSQCSEQYLRIQEALPNDCSSKLDDAHQDNIKALKLAGTALAKKKQQELEAFVKLLGRS